MLNRFITQAQGFVQRPISQSGFLTLFSRYSIGSLVTTAHHAAMVLGAVAIVIWCLMFVKPEFGNHLKSLIPTSNDLPAKVLQAPASSLSNRMLASGNSNSEEQYKLLGTIGDNTKTSITHPQQQRITTWLSKRYRLANDAMDMLVSAAYGTANEIKLDPLLILAVMAIESGFNPFAESPMGAQGLMQIMSKVHHDKFEDFGGVKAALNPVANIKVGSLILKDYVTRGGSVQAGLKWYVGAAASDHDSGYGAKVLAEYEKLKEVALGKNVPISNTASTVKPIQTSVKPEPAKIIDAENLQTIPATNKDNNVAAL